MTARTGPRRSAALGALAGGALLACLSVPAPAHAAPVAFSLAFDGLEPGVSQTRSATFTLARSSQLVAFAWLERQGLMTQVDLDIEVCSAAGECVDPTALAGTPSFPAGPTTVTVSATLVTPGEGSGSVLGDLTFTGDDLASTGSELGPIVAWSIALLATGSFAVVLARRRSAP